MTALLTLTMGALVALASLHPHTQRNQAAQALEGDRMKWKLKVTDAA